MKVKRIAAGSYEVHTNHGVYHVDNCPAENPRGSGLPAGPRWMIAYPGEETADGERATKREALEHIRVLHDEHETASTPNDVEQPSEDADKESAGQEPKPRHTVDRLGDGYFAVVDNVTGLYHRVSSNRERAQERANELNSEIEGPNQDPGPSLDDYAKASRIIQSLIPGVRR